MLTSKAPAKPRSSKAVANQTVYTRLRRDILSGKLAPGTRLVHRQLAARMGTSTIPVIDALRQLEGAGLLVTVPGQGTEVRRWEPHEWEDAYLIRAGLEGIACRLFTVRASAKDIERLQDYNAKFNEAARREDQEACDAADEKFHLHIVDAARSAELSRLVENSGAITFVIRNVMLPAHLHSPGPVGAHDSIVKALLARDADTAEQAGKAHILDSRGYELCRQFQSLLRPQP